MHKVILGDTSVNNKYNNKKHGEKGNISWIYIITIEHQVKVKYYDHGAKNINV